MGTKRSVKVMKLGDDPDLEKAVIWFRQKRMEGVPISGPLLCEKAVDLYKTLHKDAKDSDFVASEGWKWRFCKRHGIRQLSLQGEKMSADSDAASEFIESFPKFFKESCYSLDQIFNCDETGLNFRLPPTKTLAQSSEKSADGRKKSKDNCSAHPDQSELVSEDGKIIAKYVTSLIQPMDQGVIETVKRRYKKKLLRQVIIADDQGESIIDCIKSVNMSKFIRYISESWDEVSATTRHGTKSSP